MSPERDPPWLVTVGCLGMDSANVVMAGPTDEAREATIGLLQDAYVRGSIDDDELGRGIHVALTTRDASALEALAGHRDEPTVTSRSAGWWAIRGLAASVVGAVLVGFGVLVLNPAPPLEPSQCLSTGLSSETLECPAPSLQQAEIDRRVEIATSAADQAQELAEGAPAGSAQQVAAEAAAQGARRAEAAAARSRMIVADSLGSQLPPDAFDTVLEEARAAVTAALKALNDVESATNS